jgi:hypothetical protein
MFDYASACMLILNEFKMTKSELADIPRAAIQGVSSPETAAGNAMTL